MTLDIFPQPHYSLLQMPSSLFFTDQGRPTPALCSALHGTNTRDINALLDFLRQDPAARLETVGMLWGVGPAFVTALRRALKSKTPFRAPVAASPATTFGTVKRAVCMQHIVTGQVISAPSIVAFVREAKLNEFAQFQFDPVFKGVKLTLHGWGLHEALNQHLVFRDGFGNRYEGSVAELYGRISSQVLNRLRRGKPVGALVPLTSLSDPIPEVKKPYVATEYAVNLGGRTYRGRTLAEVGKQVGISTFAMHQLVHGRAESVKGVTFKGIKTRPRQDPMVANLKPILS